MKVLIDSQIMLSQKYGGVSRYFYELAKRYSEDSKILVEVPVFCSKNYYFEAYFRKKSCKKYFPKTTKVVMLINRIKTMRRLSCGKFDIFHPSYFSNYYLKNKAIKTKKTKLVVTVYDMIHELMPKYFSEKDNTAVCKKRLIFSADKIIAISNSTKRDILKLYPETKEDKIEVVYLASSLRHTSNYETNYKFEEKFVLFVGVRGGYKNFDMLIEAFSIVVNEKPDISLLCVGGGVFTEHEKNKMKELNIFNLAKQASLSDDDLIEAYSKAWCFVFPSLYEGFGIPVLEAFENDCPAILSNESSLPEVGGDAALYFDPSDSNELAECILSLNEDNRKLMIEKGRIQYKKFSWDKCAVETLSVYKELL